MINLIPNQEKKKMRKSFYYRLTVLFLVMLCVATFIAILALLPAYFFASSKNNTASKKLESQKSEPAPSFDAETVSVIKDINQQVDVVERAEKNKFLVSEKIINAILLRKISNIKINQISYENNPTTGKKISIVGTAPSREVLLMFRQGLEADPSFKNVNLPISNFVKGTNIQFFLTLTPA